MQFVLSVLSLLLPLALATGHDDLSKPLAEMSEEEAFAQILKIAGIVDAEDFSPGSSLETRGWELINSLVDAGPSEEAVNRIGPMIRIVGLHPSSTRYSVNQASMILQRIIPDIQSALNDERRLEYADFRVADPFGGTGSENAPSGYDEFLLSLKYYNDVAEGAMNIIAVEGSAADLEVFESLRKIDAEPFPVTFSSMASASEKRLKGTLEAERGIARSDNGANPPVSAGSEEGERARSAELETEPKAGSMWPVWGIVIGAIAIIGILLIRAFLRGRETCARNR